ncbi:MAG: holo-ACP synthase [Clostridiales bacterium]|nr:holo-ACP synthase [Bacillota bacterium]NLK04010.1 holo-ACP synthase [Clostridiales bacterium]
MITGIGVDLIKIERVKKACEKEGFLKKCFTDDEIELIGNRWDRAAGNFAVKEAVAKMFGTGFREISLKEIEVLRDKLGKPYVNLYGKADKMAKEQKVSTIHVSITNTTDYANAFVIGENTIK